MQRNRVMTIKKSFLDFQGERRENVQAEEVSQSYKWLNSNTYTGIWFLVKYGYIAIGKFISTFQLIFQSSKIFVLKMRIQKTFPVNLPEIQLDLAGSKV